MPPRIPLLTIVLSAGLAITATAELDLKPHYANVGGLVRRAYFADGNKQYAVTIDSETQLSEADNGALFRFTNVPQASMLLRPTPLAKLLPFDAESLPAYLKAAQALLPAGAEDVVLEAQKENVLPVNRWHSYRFVFSYHIAASQLRESITFLNLDERQQVVIKTGSRQAAFDAIAARADDIIRRWHEVLPGDEKGEN